jgi:hypothetical protein
MKRIYRDGFFLLLVLFLNSCGLIRKSPKTEFTDGFYIEKINHQKKTVYVTIDEDVLVIHPTTNTADTLLVDTTSSKSYLKESYAGLTEKSSFNQYSFDVDFLTIPLKFRPAKSGVPLQLNTNLNGAVYLGYRTDKYNVGYTTNPLKKSQRTINHYGFSMGIFTGVGNTFVSPTTTNNRVAIEYDGVVWTKGIAGIIAINNFTVGVTVGFDNLLDENRKSWIYETKPWFGLAFGLNLN